MTSTKLLLGLEKRNANPPRICSGLVPEHLAYLSYTNFLASTLGDEEEFDTFFDRQIEICEDRLDEWVKQQPNEAVQRYLSRSELGMDEKLTNYFSYIVQSCLETTDEEQ